MAEQQQGGTNNWQVTWLPDGSILITTEDEMSAADVLEFAVEIETGIQINVYG